VTSKFGFERLEISRPCSVTAMTPLNSMDCDQETFCFGQIHPEQVTKRKSPKL